MSTITKAAFTELALRIWNKHFSERREYEIDGIAYPSSMPCAIQGPVLDRVAGFTVRSFTDEFPEVRLIVDVKMVEHAGFGTAERKMVGQARAQVTFGSTYLNPAKACAMAELMSIFGRAGAEIEAMLAGFYIEV